MGKTVKKRTQSFKVFQKTWKITFHAPPFYTDNIDNSSKGLCYPDARHMHIDLDHLSEELLRHELTHVYAKELSLVELSLKGDQIEEFFCELNGKHGPLLMKQARSLYQAARKLKWRRAT